MARPKPNKPPKPKPVVETTKWERANDNLKSKGGVININGVDVHIGASPYSRWKASGQISATQERAIDHCIRLWELVGISPGSTTAGYGERVPGSGQSDPEWLVAKKMDAQRDLSRVEGYFEDAKPYWHVFENCIRHDEPAGLIGSRIMGWSNAASIHSARTTVQFVADMIARKEKLMTDEEIRDQVIAWNEERARNSFNAADRARYAANIAKLKSAPKPAPATQGE